MLPFFFSIPGTWNLLSIFSTHSFLYFCPNVQISQILCFGNSTPLLLLSFSVYFPFYQSKEDQFVISVNNTVWYHPRVITDTSCPLVCENVVHLWWCIRIIPFVPGFFYMAFLVFKNKYLLSWGRNQHIGWKNLVKNWVIWNNISAKTVSQKQFIILHCTLKGFPEEVNLQVLRFYTTYWKLIKITEEWNLLTGRRVFI